MSLVPTKLLKAIVKLPQSQEFNKFEGRLATFSFLQEFIANTNLLVPASTLTSQRASASRPVEIAVMNKYDATLITARACENDADDVTTALVPLSWNTTGFVIKEFSGGVYADNYFSQEDHYAWQLRMGLKAALEKLETDTHSFLEANVSATNASPLFGALVGDAKQVTWEQRNTFYQAIPSILRRNDLGASQVLDFTNPESQIQYDYLAHQGRQNGENLQYQVQPVLPIRSNVITPGAGISEIHYLAPQGSVGLLTWNSWSERNNDTRIPGVDYFTTVQDPIFGITWGLRVTKDCEDESATYAGITAGITTKYVFTLDYAFLRPYSSESTETPILKYEIAEEVVTP